MLVELLIIVAKVAGVIVAIDLGLMYLIWRARGIMRAQDRRARERRKKRAEARKEEAYRAFRIAQENGLVPQTDSDKTAEIPRQRKDVWNDVQRNR